jgi:pimeloyl-ACP methyl ester carboxylesterase
MMVQWICGPSRGGGSSPTCLGRARRLDWAVRSLAYRTLDWCAIQLATRHIRRCPLRPSRLSELDRVLSDRDLFGDSARVTVELSGAGNGSFVFPSLVASSFPQNNQVFGRLVSVNQEWTRHPTVILLHGWNASLCYLYTFPRLARRLARSGVNVAMIELPYHMQRRPRKPAGVDFLSSDLVATLGAARQALADAGALLGWLLERGSPRVGLWGFSLGAWLAGLMARYDSRLHFAVLTTPIVRIDRMIQELPFCEPLRRGLGQDAPDLGWLNLSSQPPRIDPSNILLMASQQDLFAPPETVEELWRAWAGTEIWRLPHGHISVMASRPVLAHASEWIVRKAS